ncbi:TolC family protein [Brevibacillus ruminantium]|uniref:TolC family protein n=1 Tax=Brevibacillus ruminantium TaxID=2950604 RepID=A0ABY4WEQ8_9BACL|nr:TolC family protein [Brevibacillus ruminantium]USG65379.1 TolC family protein [Brevibacillus ruminantium]
MNFPYSPKKWLALTMATVVAASIGVGAVATANATDTPQAAAQNQDSKADGQTAKDANKDTEKADTADKGAADAKDTADASKDSTDAAKESTEAAKDSNASASTDSSATSNTGATNANTNNSSNATTASDSINLEKAVEQAMKTNPKILNARLDAKNADLNQTLTYYSAVDINKEMMDSSIDASKQKYVGTAQAKLTSSLNALAVKVTESQIKLGVQQAYYNLLHAQADLDLKKQSLNRAQTQLKVAKAAFDVGTKAKTDILQAEMGVAGAQAALSAAENTLQISEMKFNDMLGVDVNKKWKLAQENKQVAAPSLTLTKAQDKAQEQRVEMKQKIGELELAELNVKVWEDWKLLSTFQGRIARNNVEKAKLAIEDQKRQINMEVAEDYLNLNAAKVAIDFRKKAQEAAAESYRLTNLRYENGLATTLEVIQAEEEFSDKENQYLEAIRNYNLAVVKFENSLGVQ